MPADALIRIERDAVLKPVRNPTGKRQGAERVELRERVPAHHGVGIVGARIEQFVRGLTSEQERVAGRVNAAQRVDGGVPHG